MTLPKLYNTYQRSLIYFANKLIDNMEQAEEIVNDSFIKLWERINNFKTETQIKSYLYLITRNDCFDYLRVQKTLSKNKECLKYWIGDSFEQCAIYTMIEAEVLDDISKRIDALPKCERDIMLLAIHCINANEISDRLDIPVKTVRNKRAIAIRKLKINLCAD